MDYTTVGLLASIRRRASIPTASAVGAADADLLAYANEELRLNLLARFVEMREDYFKADKSYTLTSSTSYRLPPRAVGGALRNVALLDANGIVLSDLYEIRDERLPDFSSLTTLAGYRYLGGALSLFPTSSTATNAVTLRMTHIQQPSELVAINDATSGAPRAITAINTGTKTVTVNSTIGYTTSTPCDFVASTPSFETYAIDQTPTAAGGGTVTFASLPSDLAVGDYLCLAQQSPVPQLPAEFHPILAQHVACCWLRAAGYMPSLEKAERRLKEMWEDIGVLSSPRNQGSPQKIINRSSAIGPRRRLQIRST